MIAQVIKTRAQVLVAKNGFKYATFRKADIYLITIDKIVQVYASPHTQPMKVRTKKKHPIALTQLPRTNANGESRSFSCRSIHWRPSWFRLSPMALKSIPPMLPLPAPPPPRPVRRPKIWEKVRSGIVH